MIEGIVLITLLYVAIGILFLLKHLETKRQGCFIESIRQLEMFPDKKENPYVKNLIRMNITSMNQYNNYLRQRLDKLNKADQTIGKNMTLITVILVCGILGLMATICLEFIVSSSLIFLILIELFVIAMLTFIIAFSRCNQAEIAMITKYLDTECPGS